MSWTAIRIKVSLNLALKDGFMPYYDYRQVPAHGDSEAEVFLVNEAPGPCEAHYGIPSIGDQGGNIHRALQRANIVWARECESFAWPKKIREKYKRPESKQRAFALRDKALAIRAKFMVCTNAYDRWPRSEAQNFVKPGFNDVISPQNIARLKNEVMECHKVIFICGEFAWLACHGTQIISPATRERSLLSEDELQTINRRLSSNFSAGWYMGHTRRWSLDVAGTSRVLKEVARKVGWAVSSAP